MEKFTTGLKIFGGVVAGLVIMVLLAMVMMGAFSPILIADCQNKAQEIGDDWRWLYFGGCQVKLDGKWIPLDNYRYFGDDRP